MNANLLRLFRISEERLRESDEVVQRSGKCKLQQLRLKQQRTKPFQFLAELPFWLRPKSGLYISNIGNSASKTGIAYAEIIASSPENKSQVIVSKSFTLNSHIHRALRIVCRLPRALIVHIYLRRRKVRIGTYRQSLIIGLDATRRFLRRNPSLYPLIISDLSPQLTILFLAAYLECNRAIWWQDDYHHIQAPPFPFRFGCFLNDRAILSLGSDRREALIFRRPTSKPRPINKPVPNPKIGVIVSATFSCNLHVIHILTRLRSTLNANNLLMRLHPNSKLSQHDFPMQWITVGACNKPLDFFASQIDIAVVGNSASQLRLLIEGIPVIHIAGLDSEGYDLYKYVETGIVFGAVDPGNISLTAIYEFYECSTHQERVASLVNISSDDAILPVARLLGMVIKNSAAIHPSNFKS